MRRLLIVCVCIVAFAGPVVGGTLDASPRLNQVRINLGGLLGGASSGVYGVDVAYGRIVASWLGWNISAWSLYTEDTFGAGGGVSADLYLLGPAPTGVFLNTRVGVVSGQIYSIPSVTAQIGMSLGVQHVWPGGFLLRVGSGGSLVLNYRFVPRMLLSIGYAF